MAYDISPEQDTARHPCEDIKAHYDDNDIGYKVSIDEIDMIDLRNAREVIIDDLTQTSICAETNLTIFMQFAIHQMFAHLLFDAETRKFLPIKSLLNAIKGACPEGF